MRASDLRVQAPGAALLCLLLCGVSTMVGGFSCSQSAETENPGSSSVSATVPAAGGVVEGPSGLKLEFPAGAFNGENTVTVTTVEVSELPPGFPADVTPEGPFFEITLSAEQDLLAPVILRIPLGPKQEGFITEVYYHDGSSWNLAENQQELADYIEVSTTHFSTWGKASRFANANPPCTPSCSGKVCGLNGCGGT